MFTLARYLLAARCAIRGHCKAAPCFEQHEGHGNLSHAAYLKINALSVLEDVDQEPSRRHNVSLQGMIMNKLLTLPSKESTCDS
jgi:hypothetical protein